MSEVGLQAALHVHFNFPAFRSGQAEAIQQVLRGQHTLVDMPPGSGKSLIFHLAALQLPGVTAETPRAARIDPGSARGCRVRSSDAFVTPMHLGVLERILNVNNGIAFHWIW
jgi:hypothetical protein